MKYCVDFKRKFKYNDQVDEFFLRYKRKENELTICDFMLNHCGGKRVNILIEDIKDFIEHNDIELFTSFANEHPDFDFAFAVALDKRFYDLMQTAQPKLKYFFTEVVTDYDTLNGMAELSPSDMYIGEDLCFNLPFVAEFLHDRGIRVRTFANVGQSSWKHTSPLKKFFIRPEDVVKYEPYIDVLEFYGKEESTSTYYEIYTIEKKWAGRLNEIILGIEDSDVDNRYIMPIFADRRIRCKKKCMQGSGCDYCKSVETLADTMKDNGLIFK